MKTLFIEVKGHKKFSFPKSLEKKKVGLTTTIQYLDQLKEINKKHKNTIIAGQILGCNIKKVLKIKDKVDCFFFLGEGKFHAIELAEKTNKEVYIATGEKISKTEIEKYKKRKLGKLKKFYTAETLGILVSTKPGQYKLKEAVKLKKKLKKPTYIFLDDTFHIESLENFSFIDIFINTACPRIEGNKIINIEDIKEVI